jgi:ATP-binding cassette subfamily B protein/subfamily B ATP-binding cassette protein MsbA
LTSAVTALQPWPIKLLVDCALGGEPLPPRLSAMLGGFSLGSTPGALVVVAAFSSLGLFALSSALDAGLTLAWSATGQGLVYDLAADLFDRLQRLSLLFHSRRSVGDLLGRLSDDTYCVYTVTESLLFSPGRHVLTLVTVGAVAWRLDPGLTLLTLAIGPAMGGSVVFFGQWLKQRTRQDREAQSRLLSLVQQTLAAIPVVQAFATEGRHAQEFRLLAVDAVAVSQRGLLLKSAYGLVNGLIMTIGTAIVLYFGGQQVLTGTLSLGSLLVFLAYLRSIQGSCRGLLEIYGGLKSAEANTDRVFQVLEVEDRVRDAPDARPLPARPVGKRGHVRLEGVTFGYEPGHPVLKNVTLEARPGEVVALVGQTGAGKSTLVSLIPRFYDPWRGTVTLDGMDVRDVQLASLRAQVALVLQEPFLLPLTVAENIAYGRPAASRAEIEAAAVAAGADGFIRHLSDGYDTVIGQRGSTLSGGEQQRLAIARALLKNAPMLILDEPTSALDAQTEALLVEALERLLEGRTTFIIAHRLSTIRRADRIVAIEGGRVVETGTRQELLAAGGVYHRLHTLQVTAPSKEAVG